MKCPQCGNVGYQEVIDSRSRPDGTIRRRRVCDKCGRRFSTREMPVNAITQELEEAAKYRGLREALREATA